MQLQGVRPVHLHVLGCGDAFGSCGRYNSCFLVRRDTDAPLLVDCGASSLIAMKRFGIDPREINTVFLSHLHGDHFGGLVFLLREASLFRHQRPDLTIAGPVGTEERLRAALEAFFPRGWDAARGFALHFIELQPDVTIEVNGVRVSPILVKHGCGAPPLALRLEVDGRIIAYSGDTGWVDGLVEISRDADLFICEAYTSDQAFPHHLGLSTLREHLPDIRAKRILLTHLGVDLLHRKAEIELPVAEDGLVVEL